MTTEKYDLSVVIPAFNEENRIGPALDQITAYLKGRGLSFEVIVVDDGSSDNTVGIARNKLAGVPHEILRNGQNEGKGYSVRRGVLAAGGHTILFSDADLSTPIEEYEKLETALKDGYDIAIGSRSVATSNVEIRQNWVREMMGKTFNLIARVFSFRGIHDSQCGFKAFRREPAQDIFRRQKVAGFCFDAEVLYLAQKFGFRIKEVGVIWKNSPKSKVRIVADSFLMFLDLLKIRLLHLGETYERS